jgi:hypothetical protein
MRWKALLLGTNKENGDTGEKLCVHLGGQDEVRESGAVDTGELVQDR